MGRWGWPPRAARALEMAARACRGAASALEMAAQPCPGAARALEIAARDSCSKVLLLVTLCFVPDCSVLNAPCMYMHGFTLVYIYIYAYTKVVAEGANSLQSQGKVGFVA